MTSLRLFERRGGTTGNADVGKVFILCPDQGNTNKAERIPELQGNQSLTWQVQVIKRSWYQLSSYHSSHSIQSFKIK